MKRYIRWYYILPAAVVLFLLVLVAGWFLTPKKPLDMAILNKTVPVSKDTGQADFRKQKGLFWILNQKKYVPSDTRKAYRCERDYYGPVVENGEITGETQLSSMSGLPDVLYLADAYGSGDDSAAGRGMTYDDIAAVSAAHKSGTTILGESDLLSYIENESVKTELEQLFGIGFLGWRGRYVADLSDLSDIPDWAFGLHEQQYGSTWDYRGTGVLLISESEELIVLQEGVDFDGTPLTIAVTGKYQKKFPMNEVSYYNWFELTQTAYGTDTIAQYTFHLNDTGKKKFSKIAASLIFSAVTVRPAQAAPTYYFAGDFCDYTANERSYRFLFSNLFFQAFSYDKPGDVSNFFWKFYSPLMERILKIARGTVSQTSPPEPNTASPSRLNEGMMEVHADGQWRPMEIKGFNINAVTPGDSKTQYGRDMAVYREFIDGIADMGGNCIGAYDLYPPEFYRALYEHNEVSAQTVYFFQMATPPADISAPDYLNQNAQDAIRKSIKDTVDAVHGAAELEASGMRTGGSYAIDVSAYMLGYIAQIDHSPASVETLHGLNQAYQYSGTYVSSHNGASEGILALMCDYLFQYNQSAYGYMSPVAAQGNALMINGITGTADEGVRFDVGSLDASDQTQGLFFLAYPLELTNEAMDIEAVHTYSDSQGPFPYGGLAAEVKRLQDSYPILISAFGFSTNIHAYDEETPATGVTEEEQGRGIVRMLGTLRFQGYIGGLVADYNDNWSECSDSMKPYAVPYKNHNLWKNALDPQQTKGVISADPETNSDAGMILRDFDRVNEIRLSADSGYLYVTITLSGDIDYDSEQMMFGFDTYQRNDGEYTYDPSYYAYSMSGMEFAVKFESKTSAGLYVVSSYDRKAGRYSSVESNAAAFSHACQLRYGSFDEAGNCFYQTGTTLRLRLPWNLLNFTDPSQRIVINDTRSADQVSQSGFAQTVATNGIIFSMAISDKATRDTLYIFPDSKQSTGYKTFTWNTWEKAAYTLTPKASVKIISSYFKQ